MINPVATESAKTQTRRIPLNEEQILCNAALESNQYDSISDDEWVALCEKVASKTRPAVAEEID
jgi:hypothetical protein